MTDSQEDSGGENEDSTVSRRDVLRRAAIGAAALTGVAAVVGGTEAKSCLSLAGTDAPDDFPMIEHGSTSGDFPAAPDELTIFVHGWFERLGGDATGQSYLAKQALRDAEYTGAVAGFEYDGNDPWWWAAKDDAEADGRTFADWLTTYQSQHPATDVHVICHSLGGRASLACLDELQRDDARVTSLSLLGAAVDAGSVTEGAGETGDWYDAVADGADDVYNYHSANDGILEYVYSVGEFGDEALGEEGADGTPPDNFTDVDVTDQIDDHCEYFQPDVGCLGDVGSRL
ncbi:lipase family alpha/beta hydrolase [Halorientalis brevis]|uniref:Lipase family alpha/beta hydrolase n=1 Tax=Halorientalis brevis TaxID=1126241 RepID=A0ABD6CE59_9EURY